jgi:hypothetical protein
LRGEEEEEEEEEEEDEKAVMASLSIPRTTMRAAVAKAVRRRRQASLPTCNYTPAGINSTSAN